jgi:hypothetical protein
MGSRTRRCAPVPGFAGPVAGALPRPSRDRPEMDDAADGKRPTFRRDRRRGEHFSSPASLLPGSGLHVAQRRGRLSSRRRPATGTRQTKLRPIMLKGLVVLALSASILALSRTESAHASSPQATVFYPLTTGILTSSPTETPPHHHFFGNFAVDDASFGGAASPVFANVGNATGALSLNVVGQFEPCKVAGNGGTGLKVDVLVDRTKIGSIWYFHLSSSGIAGPGPIAVGAQIGHLVTIPEVGASNSCWTGPHTHVEPGSVSGASCFVNTALNSTVSSTAALGVIGGGYATSDNQVCPPGAENPGGGGTTTTTSTTTVTATATTVTSSANPSVFGQPVTLTATVATNPPGMGSPTGAVQLFDGASPIGSGSLNGGNPPSFSITVSTLSIGNHPITAVYAGGSNFSGSTSSVLNQAVNKDPTTTTVASSANPSVFGQPVTLTATVTANPPGTGTPTGEVQLLDGTTPIGSGTLTGGQISVTVSNLNVATHPITATYGGDGSFTGSTSIAFNQVVNKAPTKTGLTANPAGSVGFGHPVTFTATVSVPPPGAGIPSGSVVFSVDGTTVQTVALNSSEQASVTTASLSPGSHLIKADYQGDGNFLASTGTLTYLVTCTVNITGTHPGALIASGDSTCIVNATLGGAIVVPKGTSLAVINSTVGGSINAANGVNAVEVCGSHFVGGAVTIMNAQGLVIVGDPGDANCAVNVIHGTLTLRNNTHGVEALGNTVGGQVISGNSGPGPFPGDVTTISGNHR